MDTRLGRIVDEVKEDTGSGAAEIFRRVLDSLSTVMEHSGDLTVEDLRDFSIQLHLAKRSMASLFNLANRIMLSTDANDWKDTLRGSLLAMEKEFQIGMVRIVENMRSTIRAKRLMTISYSSTIIHGLSSLGMEDLEVILPVSRPMGEGRKMAKALAERGLRAEIIQDSMVYSVMEEVDLVLVGADAVTPQGVVNKVGTFPLVAAARHFDLPAYAVCDWMKVSPVHMLDPAEVQTRVANNLTMRELVFEQTPLEMFTSIITDKGVLTPQGIRESMGSMPLSDVWASLP